MPSTENYITQAAADARYQALGGLGSATPATVDAGDTGTAGVSSSAARQDHEHPVSITAAQLVPAAWLAAWTSYTPTLTQSGSVVKTVNYAKYIQIGKTVMVQVVLTCASAGTAANSVIVGLPVPAASNAGAGGNVIGSGYIFDTSASTFYGGTANTASASTAFLLPGGSSGGGLGAAVFTAALAAGDVVAFTATYEAA